MKIDNQEPLVIDDAARLSKSTFLSLYTKIGYDELDASMAWHNIRVTPSGRKIMFQYGVGQSSKFYPDLDAEAKKRKIDMRSRSLPPLPEVTKRVEVKVKEDKFVKQVVKKEINVSSKTNETDLLKGSKEEIAKKLIDSGITKAKELSIKGEFSVPYAYLMLKKYGPKVG